MNDSWWLPGWQEKTEAAVRPCPRRYPSTPLAINLAGRVHFVVDADQGREMVQAATRVGLLDGIDTEYRFSHDQPISSTATSGARHPHSPTICVRSSSFQMSNTPLCCQPRSRRTSASGAGRARPACPVVAHYARSELFVLWSLGLREPRVLGHVLAEKALSWAGRPGTGSRASQVDEEALRSRRRPMPRRSSHCPYTELPPVTVFQSSKFGQGRLQSSFLTKPVDEPLTRTKSVIGGGAQLWRRSADHRGRLRPGWNLETLDRVVSPGTSRSPRSSGAESCTTATRPAPARRLRSRRERLGTASRAGSPTPTASRSSRNC